MAPSLNQHCVSKGSMLMHAHKARTTMGGNDTCWGTNLVANHKAIETGRATLPLIISGCSIDYPSAVHVPASALQQGQQHMHGS